MTFMRNAQKSLRNWEGNLKKQIRLFINKSLPSPMIWPLFKSFLLFFLVLLPLPFRAPAPVSARAPFHSSSAVTVMTQVFWFFNYQAMIYGPLLNRKGLKRAAHLYLCGDESKIKSFFVHIKHMVTSGQPRRWFYYFQSTGLPPLKTANI